MILQTLQRQLAVALKAGDRLRVDTVRFLLSAVRNAAIAKYGNKSEDALSDADVLEVIRKQVRSHRESIEAYKKAKRPELVQKESEELAILESYLPKEFSDEELKVILVPIATSGEKNFGLLMKNAMDVVKGRADGGRVSSLLKKLI